MRAKGGQRAKSIPVSIWLITTLLYSDFKQKQHTFWFFIVETLQDYKVKIGFY